MFLLRRPLPAEAARFLWAQQQAGYSYTEVGATRTESAPPGYAVDRHRVLLGHGEACFQRARAALFGWALFQTDWITLTNPQARCEAGVTVVVQVAHLGFYSLIADRVVYTVDEPGRAGFAYGTLTGHAEQGEERFLVTCDGEAVWFELYAFSRPRHPLARLGGPLVRGLQWWAGRAYGGAMVHAVAGGPNPPTPEGQGGAALR